MLTITLVVNYGGIQKKVSCGKSQTVGQLAAISMDKFKIVGGGNGELEHNGKRLESSLPIRLTSLMNNSKVELKVLHQTVAKEVKLKVSVNFENEVKTYFVTMGSNETVGDIVRRLEQDHSVGIERRGPFELSILNSTVKSGSEEMKTKLSLVIGVQTTSVMARLRFVSGNDNQVEQSRINEMLRQQMARYQEKVQLEKFAEQEAKQMAASNSHPRGPQHQESTRDEAQKGHEKFADLFATGKEDLDSKQKRPQSQHIESLPTPQSLEQIESHIPQSLEVIDQQKDLVYVPSNYKPYENPDSDYEMSVDQALHYLKIVANSGKPTNSKKPVAAKPTQFSIRIKFPDGHILQVHILDPQSLVAALNSKINQFLLPQFRDAYTLKLAYPPFSPIPLTGQHQNLPLLDSPFFTSEKIVVIWSPTNSLLGPYLILDPLVTRSCLQLPEIRLETSRHLLPASTHNTSSTSSPASSRLSTHGNSASGTKATRKLPKWFKPK